MTKLRVGFFAEDTVKSGLNSNRQPASVVARTINDGNPNNRFPNTAEGKEAPIPARPFMDKTKELNAAKWKKLITDEIRKSRGKISAREILEKLKGVVIDDIVEQMDNGAQFERISALTERLRNKDGINSTSPLVAHGELRSCVKGKIE